MDDNALSYLLSLISAEFYRLLLTGVVLAATPLLNQVWQKFNNASSAPSDIKRFRLVAAKNATWIVALVMIALLWGSKLAGFAFSVAALAGALLIVNKELIMSVAGYFLIALRRPFKVGDFIEIGGYSGSIVDLDLFGFTLDKAGPNHQLTGRLVHMPNAAVITQTFINHSAMGAYTIEMLCIHLPLAGVDIARAEEEALAAANACTAAWREEADRHLEVIERKACVDLPSAKPKVYWSSLDGKTLQMCVRFVCPFQQRVNVSQSVFKQFWQRYTSLRGPDTSASSNV
jgi:small-conductance mechanosensitive channel